MFSPITRSLKTPQEYEFLWGGQELQRAGINENKIYNVSRQAIYSPLAYAQDSLDSFGALEAKHSCYDAQKQLQKLQHAEFADRVNKEPKKSMGSILSFFHEVGSLFPILPTSNISDIKDNLSSLEEKIHNIEQAPPPNKKSLLAHQIRCEVLYAETNRIASYFNIQNRIASYFNIQNKRYNSQYSEDTQKYQSTMNQKLANSAKETRKTLDNIRIVLGFTTTVAATAIAISIITSKT